MIQDFIKHVNDSLHREADELAKATGYGAANTFEEYNRRVGKAKGIELALDIFNAAVREYTEVEDEL